MSVQLAGAFRGLGSVATNDGDLPRARMLPPVVGYDKFQVLVDISTGGCDLTPVYADPDNPANTGGTHPQKLGAKQTIAAAGSYMLEFDTLQGYWHGVKVSGIGTSSITNHQAAYGQSRR